MNTTSLITWEDRLTRLSLALLITATVYGIVAGASVTMYYDVVPNMAALEDSLGAVQGRLFLLAFVVGLFHLPLALADSAQKRWAQAAIRATVFIGPLILFVGTDGLISHWLWWSPINETDRFHILHHSLFAGAPLTLGFWIVVQRWWQPAMLGVAPLLSRRSWLVSGVVLTPIVVGMGLLMGVFSPVFAGAITLVGLVAFPVLWRWAG